MIIIKVMGGLGNQMQQYALYEKFKSIGKDAKLDISWFEDSSMQEKVFARRSLELRQFKDLQFNTCSTEEKEALLGKSGILGKLERKLIPSRNKHFYESDIYHPEIFNMSDAYLEGHWACEKYYHDIMPLLQEKIQFPESANSQNITVKKQMKAENSVSIHIRRGDYLDPENEAMFGGICTNSYYKAAEEYIKSRVTDAHFYLFSDDTAYLCENYHGDEYTIVDWNKGEDSFYDMELMSCCRHNICANSTFSFWGARLNRTPDKIVIRPAKHKNSQEIEPQLLHELWDNWVIIDGDGRIV